MAEYINKSTLLKSFAPIYEHDRYTGLTFETAKQIITDHINSFPTVDAIPIEWLKNKRDELEKEYYNLFHVYTDESKNNQVQLLNDFHAFNTVLGYWEKENEQV